MSYINLNGEDRDVSAVAFRRRYRKPVLERLGELRTLTLGGSPGVGDSGGGSLTQFPPADVLPPGFPPPGDPFQP